MSRVAGILYHASAGRLLKALLDIANTQQHRYHRGPVEYRTPIGPDWSDPVGPRSPEIVSEPGATADRNKLAYRIFHARFVLFTFTVPFWRRVFVRFTNFGFAFVFRCAFTPPLLEDAV